ncbi:MAG: AraC family transcriptional regulator [Kiritimatiellae bacterium]|jgi:AraC family transcriptional regulator|nr:AraC family transcriptional regulator [Kiritimatiellia bacterium]
MLHYVNFGERTYGRYPVSPYKRRRTEFQLIQSGTARPWSRDSQDEVAKFPPAPRLWVLGPEVSHGWTDQSDGLSRIAVFHFSELNHVMQEALRVQPAWSVALSTSEAATMYEWASSAKSMSATLTPDHALKIDILQAQLCLLAIRDLPVPKREHSTTYSIRKVEEACSVYRERIGENPDATEIAKEVGLSPAHLRRLFIKVKGSPPKKIYMDLRMHVAHQRVLQEEGTLTDLSTELGFSEPSSFSRAYKTYYGHSPAKHREMEK